MFTWRISLSTVLISMCFFFDANYASFLPSKAVLKVSFRSWIVFREESWLNDICFEQKFLTIAKGSKFSLLFLRMGCWGNLWELKIHYFTAPFLSNRTVSGILTVHCMGFLRRKKSKPWYYDSTRILLY
jgi:hypothetical protein